MDTKLSQKSDFPNVYPCIPLLFDSNDNQDCGIICSKCSVCTENYNFGFDLSIKDNDNESYLTSISFKTYEKLCQIDFSSSNECEYIPKNLKEKFDVKFSKLLKGLFDCIYSIEPKV
jgi:hypothetical protein